jgi:hypothetical protein
MIGLSPKEYDSEKFEIDTSDGAHIFDVQDEESSDKNVNLC